jgi:DNA-binding transcriptional ArsR family regulator
VGRVSSTFPSPSGTPDTFGRYDGIRFANRPLQRSWETTTGGAVLTYNQMVVGKGAIDGGERAADLLFGALADPTRRDIFRRARGCRLSVSALAREYPISLAAVQKHVAVLERAELVSKHRVGRESIVHAETDALKRAHAALDNLETVWRDRVGRMEQILEATKGDS